MKFFIDRKDAGRQLAAQLGDYRDAPNIIVLALPRGGVPVAAEVARALNAPLDVFVVRKLGVPRQEELALGAIATGGVKVINDMIAYTLAISPETIDKIAEKEWKELKQREEQYRGDRPAPVLAGKTVIVVDDGLATGATMKAAVKAIRQQKPARIIVAIPTAAPETARDVELLADEVVAVLTPDRFGAVGSWYQDFSQTSDQEVKEILNGFKQI